MGFVEDFVKRGYHYQCSNLDKLTEISNTKKIAAYIGFDCTAKSLHVGNLMQIMILRLMQQYGHKPIVIIGGATTKLGDPTGKDEMRRILSEEELEANKAGIKKSLSKFIKFGNGESDAIMLDNSEWLDGIGYMEFLRDFGRLISVNRMLTMESAKARLERSQSLSFLEFNYMLLQAYDFCHLNKHHDCILQIGGSDQWGNIIMGVELAHKTSGKEVFGITTPLLTTSSGIKMGKSINGAVWVNEEMLSPYDYFQFWRNTEDPDVLRFAKLYTEWSDEELASFEKDIQSNINNAKKDLAHRLTLLCHGKEAADNAMETARKVFEEGGVGGDLPVVAIPERDLSSGMNITDLIFAVKLSSSKSEAKKLVRGGGAYINGVKVLDENVIVTSMDIKEGYIKISSGKKNHMLVKAE